MKPFMGIDMTTDKKNETFNGDHFLVMKPSAAMAQSFEKSFEQAEETVERSKLPLVFRIVQFISGFVAIALASGILKSLSGEDSVTLSEAYQNAAWLFWVIGVCLLTRAPTPFPIWIKCATPSTPSWESPPTQKKWTYFPSSIK